MHDIVKVTTESNVSGTGWVRRKLEKRFGKPLEEHRKRLIFYLHEARRYWNVYKKKYCYHLVSKESLGLIKSAWEGGWGEDAGRSKETIFRGNYNDPGKKYQLYNDGVKWWSSAYIMNIELQIDCNG